MNFDNKLPTWSNEGTEPSTDLKTNGFQGGYKPPAAIFNWFWSKVIKAITELQTKLSAVDDSVPDVVNNITSTSETAALSAYQGRVLAEKDVGKKYDENSGEIFNDYTSNVASGICSHSEGYGTSATGDWSHAEGNTTTASGDKSHAEGVSTTASGFASHAEGSLATASGAQAHAEGTSTEASGHSSHASGYGTIANDYQTALGKYNKSSAGPTSNSDTSGDIFIVGNGSSSSRANAFRITTAGKPYGLAAYGSSGADYAEYFEWLDGNPDNEDRRGYFVTLDGEKIRKANSDDKYILGIISATASVEGDVQSEEWKEMYLKDTFGNKLTETVEVKETTDEQGNVIPAHTETRWILNPDYDSTKQYISRDKRKEWSPVGMLGKLIVIDDGTCKVNGYCKVSDDGTATTSETGYRVLSRIDETHVKVIFK